MFSMIERNGEKRVSMFSILQRNGEKSYQNKMMRRDKYILVSIYFGIKVLNTRLSMFSMLKLKGEKRKVKLCLLNNFFICTSDWTLYNYSYIFNGVTICLLYIVFFFISVIWSLLFWNKRNSFLMGTNLRFMLDPRFVIILKLVIY